MSNKTQHDAASFDDSKPGERQPDPFLSAVCRELDHGCDGLDGYTLSRLNRIRHTALEHKRSPMQFWLPTGGVVTACMLVLAVSLNGMQTESALEAPALEDLEILTSTENLEFFEDYEFYQWLAENESSV